MDSNDICSTTTIPLEKIHESWLENWGPSIRCKVTRQEIVANKRIQHLIFLQIEKYLMTEYSFSFKPLTNDQQQLFDFLIDNGNELASEIGIAWHANSLVKILLSDSKKNLIEKIDPEKLKTALSFRDRAPADLNINLELGNLEEELRQVGALHLCGWAFLNLPELEAAKVSIMFPKNMYQLDNPAAKDGVRFVSQLLQQLHGINNLASLSEEEAAA